MMQSVTDRINMVSDKPQFDRIIYAGTVYEIKFRGDRVLHLRSLKDRNLIIHVSANSSLLQEYKSEEYRNENKFSSVETSGV